MGESIVIAGAGQAGAQVALSLRQAGHEGPITLVGDEAQPPYQRPPLSKKYLAGEIDAEGLALRPDAFYEQNRITCRLGTRIEAIEREARQLRLTGGEMLSYDRLVLATGTRPRSLPLPGADLEGVVSLRSIADVDAIRAHLSRPSRIAIVGGGYIGLEFAAVARTLGHEVTVIEAQERVMQRVVSPAVSSWFEALHTGEGVTLRLGTGIASFYGTDRVEGVRLADESTIDCDMVLTAVGARPNDELATEAGIETDDGILVDAAGRTSDEAIFAAGDCTRFFSALYNGSIRLESVQNAIDQAKVVAQALTGGEPDYDPVPWFWSDQYKVKLQIAGLSTGHDEALTFGDPAAGSFFVAYLERGRLIAVDSINHPRSHMMARRAVGKPFAEGLLPEG